MKIKDFLEKHIEQYMFEDLKNMAVLKTTHPSGYGEAGYPMIITCLSGIELFGALITNTPFNPKDKHAGKRYFETYWNSCLIQIDPFCEDLAPIFRQLLRNGLDHNFFTKTGIYIYKDDDKTNPSAISVDVTKKIIAVNSTKFYKTLEESYMKYIHPIGIDDKVGLTTQSTMEDRLNEIIDAGTQQSKKLIDEYLNKTDLTQVKRFQRILGISAPPGDMSYPSPISPNIQMLIDSRGTASPGEWNKK